MKFYDAVGELNTNTENRMFTVCKGPHAGEKMITSVRKTVWCSAERTAFRQGRVPVH